MSVAMAVALCLLLITAVAVATAPRTGRDVVEDIILPLSLKSQGDRFTREEVEEVLAFAEKHGVTLEAEDLARLRRQDGSFKQELAMLFAKKDLGFYPGTWDVADQHWFGEFRIKIGGIKYNNQVIPKEGELSQQEIEQVALDTVRMRTGRDYPLGDREKYRLFRSFTQERHNPWQVERNWYLDYEPLTLDLPGFNMRLTPQGEVTDYSDGIDVVHDTNPDNRSWFLINRYAHLYSDHYGSWDAWSQEIWQQLQKDLSALNMGPNASPSARLIARQGYGPAPEGALSREGAVQAAAKAVAGKYKVSEQDLFTPPPQQGAYYTQPIYAIYLTLGDRAAWKVSFHRDYLAEVDAMSGQALVVDEYTPGNYYNRRYVLDELLPPEERTYATKEPPTPTDAPDPTPTLFPQDDLALAPQYYWDALRAIGYNGDTASDLSLGLQRDYGTDRRFWPLEMQAIFGYRDYMPDSGNVLPGLPAPGDIQQQEAVALARKAMNKHNLSYYEQSYLDALKAAVTFTFNEPQDGDRIWHITFVDVSELPSRDIALTGIDAKTGEFLGGYPARFPGVSRQFAPLGADGRPLVWRSDRYPDYYWQHMEARGDTLPGVRALLDETDAKYGLNNYAAWPLETKAVLGLWVSSAYAEAGNGYVMNGLPAPGDLSEEQALKLAWDAFVKEGKSLYTQADFDSALPVTNFVFGEDYPKGRVWGVEYKDTRREDATLGYIEMDPEDGTILRIDVGRSNG